MKPMFLWSIILYLIQIKLCGFKISLYHFNQQQQKPATLKNSTVSRSHVTYSVVQNKGHPLLAAILKYFLEVNHLSVYIFGKFILFYVSSEEIVEKDARMSLLRLLEH